MLIISININTNTAKAYYHDCDKDGKANQLGTVTISGPTTVRVGSANVCTRVEYTVATYCKDCGVTLGTQPYVASTDTTHSSTGERFKSCNGTTMYFSSTCSDCYITITSHTELCTRHPIHPE